MSQNEPPTAEDAETLRPSKRPRTILACLACRQKKRRCDAQRPQCQRCVRTQTTCHYTAEIYAAPLAGVTAGPIGAQPRDVEAGPSVPVNEALQPLDPLQSSLDIPTRASLSRSPVYEDGTKKARQHAAASEVAASSTYNGLPEYGPQQAFLSTEGVPDSSGLDEWTQLFLNQIFTSHAHSGPAYDPQTLGQPGPSSYNRQPDRPEAQHCLPPGHPTNSFPQAPRDSNSPRKSSGPGKRVGKFRIPYFSGRTAIAPGLRRVTCEVSAPPSPTHDTLPLDPMTEHQNYFDASGEVPSTATLQELLPIFEQRFGYFFCFISVPRLQEKIANEEASPILLNAICAISARYSKNYASQTPNNSDGQSYSATSRGQHQDNRTTAYSGDIFAQKAKTQALKVLSVSDPDHCAALMILSWNEFGCDRDTGLWMYSGMAERMSVDCGLDRSPAQLETEEDWTRLKFFYCLHLMDSIMVIGTGRQGSFGDALPSVVPFPLIEGTTLHDPFPFLVRLLTLARKVVYSINKLEEPARADALSTLQQEMVDIGSLMPKELQFSIQNLQPYVLVGQSTGFIFMHLWFHTLVILFYAPSILNDSETIVQEEGRDIALSSAKSISDIAAFAELVDPQAITQPFVNYPFFTAGRFFVKETLLYVHMSTDNSSGKSKPALALLKSSARQNYERMKALLMTLEFYWAGVRYITAALTQKAEGVGTAGLDIAEEGPNVTLVTALNSKAKAARVVMPTDPNWCGFGLTGAFNSPTDQAVTILRPQTHQGQMTAHSGMGLDLDTIRDLAIPYGRNPYEWENISKWINP
ncbi:hypothetical protein NCC49_003682 [Naganishia albida]|nr:hypothetical protein NCC49_003682 [Naganishia albida]